MLRNKLKYQGVKVIWEYRIKIIAYFSQFEKILEYNFNENNPKFYSFFWAYSKYFHIQRY